MAFPGGAALFDGLSLTVASGEVVAVIGPSGVGKTTLLRMIGGLEQGFEGRVTVGGVPAARAETPGFVFQDARLLPWLSAADNIRAVAPGITEARLGALLAQVGLAGQEAAWPRQLSGGMQRRLGLARAISVNPRLLLLDEPFVSLDRAVVDDLQALFLSIFRAGRPTVVLVSHDAADAAQLADRVVILRGRPARIVADFALPQPAGGAGEARGRVEVARLVERIVAAGRETAQ